MTHYCEQQQLRRMRNIQQDMLVLPQWQLQPRRQPVSWQELGFVRVVLEQASRHDSDSQQATAAGRKGYSYSQQASRISQQPGSLNFKVECTDMCDQVTQFHS